MNKCIGFRYDILIIHQMLRCKGIINRISMENGCPADVLPIDRTGGLNHKIYRCTICNDRVIASTKITIRDDCIRRQE